MMEDYMKEFIRKYAIDYDLNKNILPILLERVPEIREEFERERVENFSASLSPEVLKELQELDQRLGIPPMDPNIPGCNYVFSTILTPLLHSMAISSGDKSRLKEIMDWIEELANNPIFAVPNLVAVTVCENLITRYEDNIQDIFPFMGPATRQLCINQFERFILKQSTIDLFLKNTNTTNHRTTARRNKRRRS
jgi:hypothetical protein